MKKDQKLTLLDKYDNIVVLGGGNHDRNTVNEVLTSIERDPEILKVVQFRRRLYIYRILYYIILSLSIGSALSTITGVFFSEMVFASGMINASIVIILKSLFGPKILFALSIIGVLSITCSFFRKKVVYFHKAVIEALDQENESRIKQQHITRDASKRLKKYHPTSPAACWNPIDGHISDAQILPYLIKKTPAGKSIRLAYEGEPYYEELFVGNIQLKLIAPSGFLNVYKSVHKKFIDSMLIHIIKFNLMWMLKKAEPVYGSSNNSGDKEGIFESDSQFKFRLNHSTYVFGLCFLSRLLWCLSHDKKNLDIQKKIFIQVDRTVLQDINLSNSSRKVAVEQQLNAIFFLFQAASSPEVLSIIDINGKLITGKNKEPNPANDLVFKLAGISMMNQRESSPKRSVPIRLAQNLFERVKTFFSFGIMVIPIKRPIFLAKGSSIKDDQDLDSIGPVFPTLLTSEKGKTLILAIGGAEQNFGVQNLVVRQFWNRDIRYLGLNENLFSNADFNMGCENLVHAIYDKNIITDNKPFLVERILTQDGLSNIKSHLYCMQNIQIGDPKKKSEDHVVDLIGIYGFNAYSTKITALCLIKWLTMPNEEIEKDRTVKDTLKQIFDDNKSVLLQVLPKNISDDLLCDWDRNDIVNQINQFDDFYNRLFFKNMADHKRKEEKK